MKNVTATIILLFAVFTLSPLSAQQNKGNQCQQLMQEITAAKKQMEAQKANLEKEKSIYDKAFDQYIEMFRPGNKSLSNQVESTLLNYDLAKSEYYHLLKKMSETQKGLSENMDQLMNTCETTNALKRLAEQIQRESRMLLAMTQTLENEETDQLISKESETDQAYFNRLQNLATDIIARKNRLGSHLQTQAGFYPGNTTVIPDTEWMQFLDELLLQVYTILGKLNAVPGGSHSKQTYGSAGPVFNTGIWGGVSGVSGVFSNYYTLADADSLRLSVNASHDLMEELLQQLGHPFSIGGGNTDTLMHNTHAFISGIAGLEGSFKVGGKLVLFARIGSSRQHIQSQFPVVVNKSASKKEILEGQLDTRTNLLHFGGGFRYMMGRNQWKPFFGAWLDSQHVISMATKASIDKTAWKVNTLTPQAGAVLYLQGGVGYHVSPHLSINAEANAGKYFSKSDDPFFWGMLVGVNVGF